jgi:TorA maturation chaperone TorD
MNQVIQGSERKLENILGNVSFDRGNLYHLLATAVRSPALELAESLLNGKFYSEIEKSVLWVNARENIYNSSLEKLKKVAENEARYHPEELLIRMEEEYKRLFIAPGQAVISPFETYYRKTAEDLVIESVKKSYNTVKTYNWTDYQEFPDHISSELGFLSYLAEQEGTSWKNGEEKEAKTWRIKERTFIVHHLRKWGISFFESFEKQAELEAYQAMASVGKIFMILEHGN